MFRAITIVLACASCAVTGGCGAAESDASTTEHRTTSRATVPAAPDSTARPASARRVELLSPTDRAMLRSRLETLRSQVELYQVMLDRSPWPGGEAGARPWSWLMENGYGEPEAPANPLAPSAVATEVIIVTQPGATGASIDPADAGWVWNSTDGMLYLSGTDF